MLKVKVWVLLMAGVLLGVVKGVSQTNDTPTPYYEKIVSKGYDPETVIDMSAESSITIDEPSCAYINITNITGMPTTKKDDMHAIFECYDGNGHYFSKKVIMNAQGNNSMAFVKKNFAADFCEDDWVGETTTNLSIGNWVAQDAFHFKAYYNDYFRGTAVFGYKLYDDMLADHESFLERAGLTEYDEKARCYPDGFPCLVYLNGDYYGIFVWQLKKHRKNTNQTKHNADHIHLDGMLNNASIWGGNVDWSQIEVRNPKSLMCLTTKELSGYIYTEITDNEEEMATMGDSWVDAPENPKDINSEELSESSPLYYKYVTKKGKEKYYKLTELIGYDYAEYDKDAPCELIDEKSQYYDESNSDHVRTAAVKRNVLRLSSYWNELRTLEVNGADNATMKAAIAERFDVVSIIDYIVFSLVTANYDGFMKNWQWLTYDGVKWFVTPYDLDGTFGNIFIGTIVLPANWSYINQDYRMLSSLEVGPAYWVKTYYWSEIADRYEDLRLKGIFTPEHILQYVYDWCDRLGEDAYDSEKQKWSSYCYKELICNPNWTTTDDWTGYNEIADYDASVTYNEGDKCRKSYRIWTSTGTTTGVKPYSSLGYTDGPDRIRTWVTERLALEDEYLNVQIISTSVDGIQATANNKEVESIYNISGVRFQNYHRGVNVVRYKNGETKKVIY